MAAIVYDFYSNLSYCCYLPEIDGKRAMSCFENPQYVCRVSEIEKRTACT